MRLPPPRLLCLHRHLFQFLLHHHHLLLTHTPYLNLSGLPAQFDVVYRICFRRHKKNKRVDGSFCIIYSVLFLPIIRPRRFSFGKRSRNIIIIIECYKIKIRVVTSPSCQQR